MGAALHVLASLEVTSGPPGRVIGHQKTDDAYFVVTLIDYQSVVDQSDYSDLVDRRSGMAARIGTSQRYIWEIEAGKPSIYTDRLFAVLRETGTELSATIEPRTDRE